MKKQEDQFKCDDAFLTKIDLRALIQRTHTKNITCDICDEIFH